jgi:predicted permease
MRDRLGQSLRHALRLLVRSPFFTVTAALSLAIGIGANAAIFSTVNALILAPTRGIRDMDRLVDIGRTTDGRGFDTVSYPTYADVRDRQDVFEGAYAILEPHALSLGGEDGAERVYGEQVSASYFDVLGLVPSAGAVFHLDEEHIGTPLRKVVLSHDFWRRRFNADPAVVGTELVLNGDRLTVVGVGPEGFHGTTVLAPDLWLPLTAFARALPSADMLRERRSSWLTIGARLKTGVTRSQAQQAVDALMRGLREEYPETYAHLGLAVLPASRLPGDASQAVTPTLAVLMAIVGLVLLVACSNLAGLLVARSAARSREIAVRLALGASRASLVGLLMTETLLLFAAGTAAALVLARWMTAALGSLLTAVPVPVKIDLALDWRVVTFAALLALATGVMTGLLPAWQSARADLVSDLKNEAAAPRRQRMRRTFIALQLAFCVVLIAVASLFLRALGSASRLDAGFDIDPVDVASIDLSLAGYDGLRAIRVAEDIRARLAAAPGVGAAGIAAVIPLEGMGMGLGEVRKPGEAVLDFDIDWNVISPEFMPAIGLRMARGRQFAAADREGAPQVAIVNEQFARTVWPGQDAIGQTLETGDFRSSSRDPVRQVTVVGIAKDSKYRWIGDRPRPFIYVPFAQQSMGRVSFFLRRSTPLASASLQTTVRQILKDVDRNVPLVHMAPLREYADLGLFPQRLAASVAGALGAVALLLAAIGLYGVTAYMVASRAREIGIRIALGSTAVAVVGMMLRSALKIAAIGGAIGFALAIGASLVIGDLLFGISPLDPVAFLGTLTVLGAVTLAATYLPARRAAAVDPLRSLRVE